MQSYTLIGHPLGHSMSPWIHERLFALSGVQAQYTLTDIEDLAAAQPALRRLGGYNITIPHKVGIIPFLDALDETAQRYGAVNCVCNRDGQSTGYNTDCTGFLRSVEDLPLSGRVLLIGCGGVGRMMAREAAQAGAALTLTDRDPAAAQALAASLLETCPGASVRAVQRIPEEDFDLLMNACPVGMYPRTDACPVEDAVIERSAAVFDVIYNPVRTRLVEKALALGKPARGGSAMLVWQAVRAHEIWYGAAFDPARITALIGEMEAQITRDFPTEGGRQA